MSNHYGQADSEDAPDPVNRREALRVLAAGYVSVVGMGLVPGPRAQSRPAGTSPVLNRAGEILIRGGEIVNAGATRTADLLIAGEQIAEIGSRIEPPPGARVIEAGGLLVLPGGIDPHTHLSPPFADDLTSGSAAALAGGITTVGTFAYPSRGGDPIQAIDSMAERVRTEAIADVILHAFSWPPVADFAERLPELVTKGQPSIKIFMLMDDFDAQTGRVIEILEAARDAGVVTMIHCEDATLLKAAVERLKTQGMESLRHYAESRPVIAEVAATQKAVMLCEWTRAPMYVVHLSSARALEACRNPNTVDLPLFVETRPMYLHLTDERYQGPEGPLYVGQPPLRRAPDVAALWDGLAQGTIDVLGTDHAPWTREQKLDPNLTIERLRPGGANLQVMLPMLYSEGVVRGRITAQRFVEVTATNPAKIFGLYPRKGVLQAGAFADVVIWDPRLTKPVRSEDSLSKAGFSVYHGWEVTGWPVTTIRRGEVVFENGNVTGRPGSGELLKRNRWTDPGF